MNTIKRLGFAVSMTLALAGATALSAQAQDQHHDNGGHPERHGAGHPVAPHGRPMGVPHGAVRAPDVRGGGNRGMAERGREFRGHGEHGFAERGRGFGAGHRFSHHDFAHFSPREQAEWRGGRWNHGFHDGRNGWWWSVGGIWYFYDAPVYPYPLFVADYYWDAQPAVAPAYAPGYWYWCSAAGAYYPYVQSCPVPWMPVAPTQ